MISIENLKKNNLPHSNSLIAWMWFFIRPHKKVFGGFTCIRIIAYILEALPMLFSALLAGYTGSYLSLKLGDKVLKILFSIIVFSLAL